MDGPAHRRNVRIIDSWIRSRMRLPSIDRPDVRPHPSIGHRGSASKPSDSPCGTDRNTQVPVLPGVIRPCRHRKWKRGMHALRSISTVVSSSCPARKCQTQGKISQCKQWNYPFVVSTHRDDVDDSIIFIPIIRFDLEYDPVLYIHSY